MKSDLRYESIAMSEQAEYLGHNFEQLCRELVEQSGHLEKEQVWPDKQFDRLADENVTGWVIPQEYGGLDLNAYDLTHGYEQLAAACLVTTFVLTQRNGACQRIARAENETLKTELLPPLRRGEIFATVGISHLTTSRRHLKEPAVTVEWNDSSMVLNGTIPWVTGGLYADYIVTGGVCDDGLEVLVAVPCDSEGVECLPPIPMMALNSSQTGAVRLDHVKVDERFLIAGPVEGVMSQGVGGGTGSVATSALALGAVAGILNRFEVEVERRADLSEAYELLNQQRNETRDNMYESLLAAERGDDPQQSNEEIRQQANSLVLRASQAYLTATKGAGFITGHPAERAVREAMFFLVWSCPQAVAKATLHSFACGFER